MSGDDCGQAAGEAPPTLAFGTSRLVTQPRPGDLRNNTVRRRQWRPSRHRSLGLEPGQRLNRIPKRHHSPRWPCRKQKRGDSGAAFWDEPLAMTCCGRAFGAKKNAALLGRRFRIKNPGDDLLLHGLGHTTIGAAAFHFRVRDGIGWFHSAMVARERVEGRSGSVGKLTELCAHALKGGT